MIMIMIMINFLVDVRRQTIPIPMCALRTYLFSIHLAQCGLDTKHLLSAASARETPVTHTNAVNRNFAIIEKL